MSCVSNPNGNMIIDGLTKEDGGIWQVFVPNESTEYAGLAQGDLVIYLSRKRDSSETVAFFEKWGEDGGRKDVIFHRKIQSGVVMRVDLMGGCRYKEKSVSPRGHTKYHIEVDKISSYYPQT